jgi:hypothetical protein
VYRAIKRIKENKREKVLIEYYTSWHDGSIFSEIPEERKFVMN